MRLWDISAPIRSGMGGFPGDSPVSVTPTQSLSRGDPYSISALALSSHTGTHVDPPAHFVPGGLTVDQIDLSILNGPCRVVRLPDEVEAVGTSEVARVPTDTSRVLFRTRNSTRWRETDQFFEDYVAVAPTGAEALVRRNVRLVGIDSLSVERDPTGRFPVHHRLLGAGTLILEGLRLADVPEGDYDLNCLPLRLERGDGGLARAILLAR